MFCRFLSRLLFLAGPGGATHRGSGGERETTKHIIEIWSWAGWLAGRQEYDPITSKHTENRRDNENKSNLCLSVARPYNILSSPLNISVRRNAKSSPSEVCEAGDNVWDMRGRGGEGNVSKQSRKDKMKCWELRLFLTPRPPHVDFGVKTDPSLLCSAGRKYEILKQTVLTVSQSHPAPDKVSNGVWSCEKMLFFVNWQLSQVSHPEN